MESKNEPPICSWLISPIHGRIMSNWGWWIILLHSHCKHYLNHSQTNNIQHWSILKILKDKSWWDMTSVRFDEQTNVHVSDDWGTLFTIDFSKTTTWRILSHLARKLGARAWRKFLPMEREMKMRQSLALFAKSKRFRVPNIRDLLGFICSWLQEK